MRTRDLSFDLPPELIAQFPSDRRGNDRLLCIDRKTGALKDMMFSDMPDLLPEGSVLVLNDSKVRKARVFAKNEHGGEVELLFLHPDGRGQWVCVANRIKRRRVGEILQAGDCEFRVMSVGDDTIAVMPLSAVDETFFDRVGHVPLPPYIRREDEFRDESRYQTVYAERLGSVASPTAGLHWTEELLERVRARGIEIVKVTLHVGMGTFAPVRSETLEEHRMHCERYEVSPETASVVNAALSEGRPVIANGTTAVRTLESVYDPAFGKIMAASGETSIFITPGYRFNVVSGLITNFHTPESTLVALVSAFSSLDIVKGAYAHAVAEGYRFFSYGDATFFS